MKAQFVQIRDQQKEIRNRFSPGWKKCDDLIRRFLKPIDALSKADYAIKINVKSIVLELINQKYSNGKLEFESNAHVIYGEK